MHVDRRAISRLAYYSRLGTPHASRLSRRAETPEKKRPLAGTLTPEGTVRLFARLARFQVYVRPLRGLALQPTTQAPLGLTGRSAAPAFQPA